MAGWQTFGLLPLLMAFLLMVLQDGPGGNFLCPASITPTLFGIKFLLFGQREFVGSPPFPDFGQPESIGCPRMPTIQEHARHRRLANISKGGE
jgi:hypothetical protein